MTIREEFRAYLNESDYDDKQAKALYSFIKNGIGIYTVILNSS